MLVPAGDHGGAGIDGIKEKSGLAGVIGVDSDFNITAGRGFEFEGSHITGGDGLEAVE